MNNYKKKPLLCCVFFVGGHRVCKGNKDEGIWNERKAVVIPPYGKEITDRRKPLIEHVLVTFKENASSKPQTYTSHITRITKKTNKSHIENKASILFQDRFVKFKCEVLSP